MRLYRGFVTGITGHPRTGNQVPTASFEIQNSHQNSHLLTVMFTTVIHAQARHSRNLCRGTADEEPLVDRAVDLLGQEVLVGR